jgi:hypothetical protein
MIIHRLALALSALLLFVACDTPCPGGHDPLVNPVGESCNNDTECTVECVCNDADGDQSQVTVGKCQGQVCLEVADLCEEGCATTVWSGTFCTDE